jgi:PAS domain S-box-containing protein
MAHRFTPKPSSLPAHQSLRWRLPGLVVALIATVLAAFLWTAYDQVERTLIEAGEARAQAAADQVAGLLAPAAQQRTADMKRVAIDPAIRDALLTSTDLATAAATARLRSIGSTGRQVTELWDRNGTRALAIATPAAGEGFPPPVPPTDVPLRLMTTGSGPVIADQIEPVNSADGRTRLGYLVVRRPVATTPPEALNRLIGDGARVHLGGGGQWTDLVGVIDPSPLERSLRPGVAQHKTAAGDSRLGAVAEVPRTPWLASVDFPTAVFIAPARAFLYRALLAGLVLALVAGALSRLVTSRITTPLAALTRASEAIASGDFSKRVDVSRTDEIGRLGSAFNSMVGQIQEAHEHLMLAVQGSRIGIWEWDVETDLMFKSSQFESLLGYAAGDLEPEQSAMVELVHPDDRGAVLARIRACLASNSAAFESEHRLRRKDGTYAWILARAEVSRNAAGRAVRMAGTIIDTTGQRKVRDEAVAQAREAAFIADVAVALTEGRALRDTLSRCAQAMVQHLDASLARVWTASLTEPVLELQASAGGDSPDTAPAQVPVGTSLVGRVARDRQMVLDNAFDPAREPGQAHLVPPDCVSYVGLPLIVGSKLLGVMCMFGRVPVTENTVRSLESVARTVALGIERQRLDESRARFEDLLESATDFVTIGQIEGPPLYVNRAARQAFGLSQTDPIASLLDFRPPDYREFFESTVMASALRDGVWRGRAEYSSLSGRRIPVSQVSVAHTNAAGNVQYLSTISRDISEELRQEEERERFEDQLQRAQRMEAVGQLAGGLAHDFNNLLTIVLGFANVLGDQLESDDARRKDVEQIQRAGQRAAQLTRQLLAFSRKQVLNPVVLDPAAVVSGLAPMLRRLVGESIDVVVSCDRDASAIMFDPTQLELILVNLVVNARDAMPNGGQVTIEVADVTLDEEFCRTHLSVEPGHYVRLTVTDNGMGIDEATRERIFEPFFTTKGRDKGTGLGLATVFGIVKQSGGSIWVYSEPGLGASFKIFLPATTGDRPVRAAGGSTAIPRGSESVLVVEDEAGVRVLVETVLKRAGYVVRSAGHPLEAIEMAADPGQRVDLLITDVVMPDMNGVALARRLRENRPTLRVLFMSGFADDAIEHHGVVAGGRAFLQKPFTGSDLAHKVRGVLDEETAGVL